MLSRIVMIIGRTCSCWKSTIVQMTSEFLSYRFLDNCIHNCQVYKDVVCELWTGLKMKCKNVGLAFCMHGLPDLAPNLWTCGLALLRSFNSDPDSCLCRKKIRIELRPKIRTELCCQEKSELNCCGIKSELNCQEIRIELSRITIELSRNHNLIVKKSELNCQKITTGLSKIRIELQKLELNNEPSGPS